MKNWHDLAAIRREYGGLGLDDEALPDCPLDQFQRWFSIALEQEKSDPTAMVLSTVDERGMPDSRVVLLKGLEENAFIFYTNYLSHKGKQLATTPFAALNFYWPKMARQVRVRGAVKRCSSEQSDLYFSSRPVDSQIAAIASHQSQPLTNRAELEQNFSQLKAHYLDNPPEKVPRPSDWGGYVLHPTEFEFWQGRDNRLHDRIHYVMEGRHWSKRRLAP